MSTTQDLERETKAVRGDFHTIPLVDVADLKAPDLETRRKLAGKLDRAARTAGFLYVTNHGVSEPWIRDVHEQARLFFALPEAAKMQYYIGLSENHRGYVPPGEEVFYGQSKDTKEGFDLSLDLPRDDPDYRAGNRLLGPNVWPAELPDFALRVSRYYDEVLAFGKRLLRGFALALGLPETHFDSQVTKPPSQLRLLHYPMRAEIPQGAMGIGSHTDYECFTVLHTTAPGLEVMNAEGRWIDAPPVPGAFVVNIGDMLEVMTNGEWVSTAHRVRPVTEERYSFPFFFSLDYRTVVEPLALFEKPGVESAYKPLVAGEHLLAQTAQSFTYYQKRIERGEFKLHERAHKLASFGRDRQGAAEPEAGGSR